MSEMKTWIQALAESLGAASLLSDVFPNVPIHVYPHPKPADMRTCGYALGTPELNLMDVLKSEILPFYGLQPPWGKCCSLGAVYAGPQSTFERTASYLIGYLHGYRVFDEGGILNGGEVFSPVQLLFDIEILSWAERYGRGVCWTASQLDLDRWVEMATRGDLFAENPNEVALLRTVYDRESRFFPVHSVGQHIANRQDPIRDAKERIRCLVAAHVYEPDPGLIKEVERIVEHARQHPPR
jgi:trimethylamine:corrinoid methyltransferase-like protein